MASYRLSLSIKELVTGGFACTAMAARFPTSAKFRVATEIADTFEQAKDVTRRLGRNVRDSLLREGHSVEVEVAEGAR